MFRFLKHPTFFTLSVCLIALILEIFIRIFIPQQIVPNITVSAFGVPNALKANLRADATYGEGIPYHIETNGKHLRHARDIPYEKPENIFRILCLGDSILFGYGVNHEETFAHYLEKTLNEKLKGNDFEVLNASAPGWSPFEYYAFLKNEGYKYKPDIVLATKFIDDITEMPSDRVEFEDLSFERLTDKKAKISYRGINFRFKRNDWLDDFFQGLEQSALYAKLVRSSHLLNLARDRLSRLLLENRKTQHGDERSLDDFLFKHGIKPDEDILLVDRGEGHTASKNLISSQTKTIQHEIVVEKISDLADQLGAKFLLVELPVYQEVLGLVKKTDLGNYSPADHFFRFSVLRPFSQFQNQHPISLYFPKDNHWTPAGHHLMALLTYNYLINQNLLPQSNLSPAFEVNIDSPETAEAVSLSNQRLESSLQASPDLLFINAMIYQNSGRFDLAKKNLLRYLPLKGNDYEAHFRLGLLYAEEKNYSNALEHLLESTKAKDDRLFMYLLQTGRVYGAMQKFDKALYYLREAEKDEKLLPQVYSALYRVYRDKGDFQKAAIYSRKITNN